MKEGDVVLAALPISGGGSKNRPVVVLKAMRPYDDLLVCGVSTQMHQAVEDFDEILSPGENDYVSSGVAATSLIRLGYLGLVSQTDVLGTIGEISKERHK